MKGMYQIKREHLKKPYMFIFAELADIVHIMKVFSRSNKGRITILNSTREVSMVIEGGKLLSVI